MYLVIETADKENEYIHFINIKNGYSLDDMKYFIKHLQLFPNQKVKKVYTSNTKLTNW